MNLFLGPGSVSDQKSLAYYAEARNICCENKYCDHQQVVIVDVKEDRDLIELNILDYDVERTHRIAVKLSKFLATNPELAKIFDDEDVEE